jgi:hypothetical protein
MAGFGEVAPHRLYVRSPFIIDIRISEIYLSQFSESYLMDNLEFL